MSSPELDALDAHLTALATNPTTTPPDAALFDRAELALNDTLSATILPAFLPRLTHALENLSPQYDPRPIASFVEKLVRPVPFAQVLELAPPGRLVAALDEQASVAGNLLGLALVRKAAASVEGTSLMAGDEQQGEGQGEGLGMVLDALLTLWMRAPDVGVGDGAGRTVLALLERDSTTRERVRWGEPLEGAARGTMPPVVRYSVGSQPNGLTNGNAIVNGTSTDGPGAGALWKKLLETDGTTAPRLVQPLVDILGGDVSTRQGRNQASLAQDRVLRILPELAVLGLPELVREFSVPVLVNLQESGTTTTTSSSTTTTTTTTIIELSTHPIDRDDILATSCIIDFFTTFACLVRASKWADGDESILAAAESVRRACGRVEGLREALVGLPVRVVGEERAGMEAWVARWE